MKIQMGKTGLIIEIGKRSPNCNLELLHGVFLDDDGRVDRLILDNNAISGSIPAEISNLSNLTHLYLYENQLSSSLPAELGNLINLTDLLLNNNQLSGSLPVELGTLKIGDSTTI